ncbi:MAG: hypothetical protein JRN15_22225, partial [Nitrososphaerota archaeon]|nr:hypothetical protein [Nitrososphaerota archaeon]
GLGGAANEIKVINLWQVNGWNLIHQLNTDFVNFLCFNTEGDVFASADVSGMIKLWHIVSVN